MKRSVTQPCAPTTTPKLAAFGLAALTGLALAPDARANGPDACGGIELTSINECHFEFDGGCKAKCEPLRFTAACDGQCNASASASCTSSCNASCDAACSASPGTFDCRAECTADCNGNVVASCGGDKQCESIGQASCSAECQGRCEATPPSANCQAQCNACCGGSCDVDASLDCRVDCSFDMRGGCELDCEAPSGALFCDGQYIAVQDLPGCVAYLVDNLKIDLFIFRQLRALDLDLHRGGTAGRGVDEDHAVPVLVETRLDVEASASAVVSCSYSPGPNGAGGFVGLSLVGLGLVLARRRRLS